jgi:hypothetical protein
LSLYEFRALQTHMKKCPHFHLIVFLYLIQRLYVT